MSIENQEIEPRRLSILADEIRAEVAAADAGIQSAVRHAIQAGEKLIEAEGLVRHGEWLPWLEANLNGSADTAGNYMRLARNSEHVRNLPSVRQALALLSAPKEDEQPELTSEQALERLYRIRDWLAEREALLEATPSPMTREWATLWTESFKTAHIAQSIVLCDAYDLRVHEALGLTWAGWVDRIFPPGDAPASFYVRARGQMIAIGEER
jgi:hypothetical protein